SLWNKNRTPVSEAYAWQALELIVPALPVALKNPEDIEARENLQQASLLAGVAISQTRTAIAHSISYPLTSHFGVPHGIACSFTLPALIEVHLSADVEARNRRQILEHVLRLLHALRLVERVGQHLSLHDVESVETEMIHPQRAMNFIHRIDIRHVIH